MGWTPLEDDDAIHDDVSGEIAAITEKVSPVNTDLVIIEDSAASNAKKRVQVGNLPGGGGGGGGPSYITMPGLRPPTSGDGSDDEFNSANGTDPTSGSWAWANQGSSTAVINHGMCILDTNGSTTNSWRGIGKAAPVGDFTMDVAVTGRLFGNYHGTGPFLLWGTLATPTSGLEGIRYAYNASSGITAHATNTSFVGIADRFTTGAHPTLLAAPYSWLRLDWTSSTEVIEYLYSVNGHKGTWVSMGTYTATGLGDPDFTCLMVEKNGQEMIASFPFVRFNWTPDFDASLHD